jgi:hypothetical protein
MACTRSMKSSQTAGVFCVSATAMARIDAMTPCVSPAALLS